MIVDDEPAIIRLLRLQLTADNYRVVAAGSAEEAIEVFAAQQPDLVLLDIILPGAMSGFDVLKAVKAHSDVPVILLTAQSTEQARLDALALGADDFVSKPFSPERVTNGIRFLLGRGNGESDRGAFVRAGDLEIDLTHEVVRRAGDLVDLNRSEWLLLAQLAEHPGEPRLYQELLSTVWGAAYRDDLAYLRAWIARLRTHLGDSNEEPRVVLPYLDVGFLLNAERRPTRP
jgi:two-component system KDP operon response regulator KdpE